MHKIYNGGLKTKLKPPKYNTELTRISLVMIM